MAEVDRDTSSLAVKILNGVFIVLAATLIAGSTAWAILKMKEARHVAIDQPAISSVDRQFVRDPAPLAELSKETPPISADQLEVRAAEVERPIEPPRFNRPAPLDASVGTRLDPLTLKGWDLSSPKTVPSLNLPNPRQGSR